MQYRQLASMSTNQSQAAAAAAAFHSGVPPAAVAAAAAAAAAGMRPNSAGAAPNLSHFMDLNGSDPLSAAAVAGMHSSLSGSRSSSNGNLTPNNINNNGGNGSNAGSHTSPEKHYSSKHSNNNANAGHLSTGGHHSSPMPNSRTRIRTSFDPEMELPKLHKWFAENRHPSRSQVQEYVKELNALDSRRGRKPLDVNNVVYWFKNARAAHKRAELKFVTNDTNNIGGSSGGGNGHGSFNSFGHNLSNDFFGLNGHSPGKHDAKGNNAGDGGEDLPMSNASRNGSNLDGYYSFEDDVDSREEAQTLDLSMRNNLENLQAKMFFGSPRGLVDVKLEELEEEIDNDAADLKIIEPEERCEQMSSPENGHEETGKQDQHCEGSSECNSIDEESDEETSASSMMGLRASMLHASVLGTGNESAATTGPTANHPESPESRRTRRSRTFIDPMSEVS